MADIDALLGLRGGTETDTRALARELRGQRDLGDFLSISTIKPISDLGASQRKRAVASATRAGRLRDRIAARRQRREIADRRFEYDQGRDEIADRRYAEELAYERGKLGDAESFVDPDGNYVTVQQRADGRYVDSSGAEVDISSMRPAWRPTSRGMGGYTRGTLKVGNVEVPTRFNRATGVLEYQVPGTQGWTTSLTEVEDAVGGTAEPGASPLEEAQRAAAEAKGGEKFAEESAKSRVKRADTMQASSSGIRATVGAYQGILDAIEEGANTGVIASRLPSFRDATVKLEALQAELAMEKIAEHTFGSLSEAEAQWLRDVAVPTNLDEDDLAVWIQWKMEGAQRMLAAQEYAEREMRANREPDPARMREIRAEGGYRWDQPPTKTRPNTAAVPDDLQAELDGNEALAKRFNAMTPAQRRRLIERFTETR